MVLISLVAIVVLAGLGYIFLYRNEPTILPQLPTTTAVIGGQTFTLDVATTTTEQNRGLGGRTSLGERNGMLFMFNIPSIQLFWMKDMEFPLDLIWMRGNKIIGFEENMTVPTSSNALNLPIYISPGLVDGVIEINSGQVAQLGLRVGDAIQISPLN